MQKRGLLSQVAAVSRLPESRACRVKKGANDYCAHNTAVAMICTIRVGAVHGNDEAYAFPQTAAARQTVPFRKKPPQRRVSNVNQQDSTRKSQSNTNTKAKASANKHTIDHPNQQDTKKTRPTPTPHKGVSRSVKQTNQTSN